MKLKDFVPQVLTVEGLGNRYGTMLVALDRCESCKRPMVKPGLHGLVVTLEEQAKRADWGIRSRQHLKNNPICIDCAAAGMASSVCVLCKQERPSNQIERSFGDPPEHLCAPCYMTVPAKQWDDAVAKLETDHQYDFE